VSEGVRHDIALRALHDLVVAHGRSCAQPFLKIAGIEQIALLGKVTPYAGVAVGLQLDADGDAVAFGAAQPLLGPLRLFADARQVLDDTIANIALRSIQRDFGIQASTLLRPEKCNRAKSVPGKR